MPYIPNKAERLAVQEYRDGDRTLVDLWRFLGAHAADVCFYYGLPLPPESLDVARFLPELELTVGPPDSSDSSVVPLPDRSPEYWIIRDALQRRVNVRCVYLGKPRVLSPHILGLNRAGEEQGLFYQVAGGSNSGILVPGAVTNFRCMALGRMADVEIDTSSQWETATLPTVNREGKGSVCVHTVDIAVNQTNSQK